MLREKLQARLKELAEAIEAFTKKESLTAEELAAMEKATAEVAEVEKQIQALDAAEAARARVAAPAPAPAADPSRAPAQVKEKLKPSEKIGLLAAGMVTALRAEGARGFKPTMRALEAAGFGELASEFEGAQTRTLNSGSATAGGILVPEDMSSDIIDLLRNNATFLQGNPRVVPMPSGNYKLPAAASGATAGYRGETKPSSVSQPTFKAINMSAKLLAATVPISNQLIRWSLPNVRQWVETDMSSAMGLRMDLAAFRGDGLQDTPLGITRIPGVVHHNALGATAPSVAQADATARLALNMIESFAALQVRVEWRMHPRVFGFLQDMRDGNSNPIYPTLQTDNPTWKGYTVRKTTQIPANLGGTTDESEIYLVAFGHVLYGDALRMQLAISDVASVVNGNQTINAFQDGVTVIRAEAEHDFDVAYVEAVQVIDGVRWGA